MSASIKRVAFNGLQVAVVGDGIRRMLIANRDVFYREV
jgi:hypothetical protein